MDEPKEQESILIDDEIYRPSEEILKSYIEDRDSLEAKAKKLKAFWADIAAELTWKVYWEKFPCMYETGDSAKRDQDGYVWILGRMDDVITVSGYRFGRAEIEFVESLPKTRSVKIMRRVLKAKELGLPVGDLSTMED